MRSNGTDSKSLLQREGIQTADGLVRLIEGDSGADLQHRIQRDANGTGAGGNLFLEKKANFMAAPRTWAF